MPKQKPNEQVQQIPLSEIRPFKNHPFKVTDDELMQQTIDSIMQVGVLNPAIIRPAPEGGYEMVLVRLPILERSYQGCNLVRMSRTASFRLVRFSIMCSE